MVLYLDTCVWIAYFDKEEKFHDKAVQLIDTTNEDIAISDTVHYELRNRSCYRNFIERTVGLLSKSKLLPVIASLDDKQAAYKLNLEHGLGYGDFLHLLICKRNEFTPVSLDKHWKEIAAILGMDSYDLEGLNI